MRTGFGDLECSSGRASMRENRAIKATATVNADDILLVIDQKGLTEQMQFRYNSDAELRIRGEGLYAFI